MAMPHLLKAATACHRVEVATSMGEKEDTNCALQPMTALRRRANPSLTSFTLLLPLKALEESWKKALGESHIDLTAALNNLGRARS